MKPYFEDNLVRIYNKDCRHMDELPDNSVQCVVTSPPYWGLRKYSGLQDLIWGDNNCEHEWIDSSPTVQKEGGLSYGTEAQEGYRDGFRNSSRYVGHKADATDGSHSGYCSLCGAWKGQYGLEPTPEMYVQHTIGILREIRRVLRKDGVVFWNIGDSYAGSWGNYSPISSAPLEGWSKTRFKRRSYDDRTWRPANSYPIRGLKPKDLCLIPFRVALEAQKPYYAGRIRNELDRVWMAAMIDTEGTVCGFRHERPDGNIRTGVLVFVTNGNEDLLSKCDRIWLGARYLEHLKAGDKVLGATATQDCWRWQIQKAEDRSLFLREIYPYMVAKKLQVMVGWNLNEYSLQAKKMGRGGETKDIKTKRELLAKILSDLNQHRPVDIPKWVKEPPSVLEPGWYVRSIIVWSKNNPMPESVTDRPTESHEYILMLTKSARYYWDADAVREPHLPVSIARTKYGWHGNLCEGHSMGGIKDVDKMETCHPNGRNIRTVWEFPTQPYPEAHFAVFPEKLPEICIKAATPEVGCCSKCGSPWERILDKKPSAFNIRVRDAKAGRATPEEGYKATQEEIDEYPGNHPDPGYRKSIGWQATCKCNADKVPSIVLDPFMGSGTTLWVAKKLGRRGIGYELSEEYCALALERNRQQVMELKV